MRIEIATDGSEFADAALQSFLARPWPKDSVVLVVSVTGLPYPVTVPDPPLVLVDQPTGPADAHQATREKHAQTIVARACEAIRSAGFSVEGRVLVGDARVEILQAALDFKAELIIVGSHGRTGLSRWLIGSVAEYVVRHAPCSVEVVRGRRESTST